MATSEAKELKINQHLDALDELMEDGPTGIVPEEFLRQVQAEARQLVGALEDLTPEDVDEIWAEDESEDESEDKK